MQLKIHSVGDLFSVYGEHKNIACFVCAVAAWLLLPLPRIASSAVFAHKVGGAVLQMS
jgi:hypothetical protein